MATHYEDLKQAVVSSLESTGVRFCLTEATVHLFFHGDSTAPDEEHSDRAQPDQLVNEWRSSELSNMPVIAWGHRASRSATLSCSTALVRMNRVKQAGGPSSLQVLAKLRAELTFSVFESVDATERVPVNPQRDAFAGKGTITSLDLAFRPLDQVMLSMMSGIVCTTIVQDHHWQRAVLICSLQDAEDGVVALSLVQDLLTHLGLVCTSRLFEKEARLRQPMTREQLTSRLGLPSAPSDEPVILSLVSGALAPSPKSIQEESVLTSEVIGDTQAPTVLKPTVPKDTQGVLDSFHEADNTTPTRIPSFVGSAPISGQLQPFQVLSPDEASAPYALPSDSGESIDGDAVTNVERVEQEVEHPSHWQSESVNIMDTSGVVNAGQTSEAVHLHESAVHLHESALQEDTHTDMVQKAAPAPLAPIPRKNLPPLGPVRVADGGGVGMFNSSPAPVGGYAMAAPGVRDARREGQELLGILGSPSESEDDELPELHRLPDPDMLSDDGDFGGAAGLDLLLPDSSSDSAT